MIDSFSGENRWLSNFDECEITFEDVKYRSIENAYQASKTLSISDRRALVTMSAGQAKRAGEKLKMRSDWEDIKVAIMTDLLEQKFSKPRYRKLLLDTGDKEIREGNTDNGLFWGVNVQSGEGQNTLGKIIMKIRQDISRA